MRSSHEPVLMLVDTAVCAGPLFRYPVSGSDNDETVRALAECGTCGAVFVTPAPLDTRHLDTIVVDG